MASCGVLWRPVASCPPPVAPCALLGPPDSIRTGVFLAQCRGPQLVAWSEKQPEWRLSKSGAQSYLFDFDGQAGDGDTRETARGNAVPLQIYMKNIKAASSEEDPIVKAMSKTTKAVVVAPGPWLCKFLSHCSE